MHVGAHSCGADRLRGRKNLATQPMPTLLAMGPWFEPIPVEKALGLSHRWRHTVIQWQNAAFLRSVLVGGQAAQILRVKINSAQIHLHRQNHLN